MPNAKDLAEKRSELATRILQMRDDGLDTSEKETNWQTLNHDFDDLTKAINIELRSEEIKQTLEAPLERAARPLRDDWNGHSVRARELSEPVQPRDEDRELALLSWIKCGRGATLNSREELACKLCAVDPRQNEFELRLATGLAPNNPEAIERRYARRDLTKTSTGITMPTAMVSAFELALVYWNSMRQVAQVLRTDDGNNLLWPCATDLGNVGARITTEGAAVLPPGTAQVEPAFNTVTLSAYKYSSKGVLVSFELLQDHPRDLAAIIGEMLGTRIGRIQNLEFTLGTGSSQPRGIVTGVVATAGAIVATTAAQDQVLADDIISLVYAVNRAYRGRNAKFMTTDVMLGGTPGGVGGSKSIRKMIGSGSGEYIWQPGLKQGEPDLLLGYPVVINPDMDSAITVAAENYMILFGDLSSYKIRDVASVRLRRLEERYADTDQIAFIAFLRSDGNYVNPGDTGANAGNPVKVLNAT